MRIDQGFPIFYSKDGTPLKNGKAYIGTAGLDAETNLVGVFYDDPCTIPAPNPISIQNGVVTRRGLPVAIFTPLEYSITVRDSNGVLQFSSLNGAPISAADITTSLVTALDATYVKKSGDVMTGPLAIHDAVGVNDLYSRAQEDVLFGFRPSATYVVNSVQKWVDLGNNLGGNDYTDVLVKRGTWNVSPITLPATCKRLRGELGAELYFGATIVFNYGILVPDGQSTEITGLLCTLEISQDPNANNVGKTVIIGRDCEVHDLEIAFVVQGGATFLAGVNLVGVSSSNVHEATVNAYNKDAATINASSLTVVGAALIAPSTGQTIYARNVSISQYSYTILAKLRYGTLACNANVNQVFVSNPSTCDAIISWKTPKVNKVGLTLSGNASLNFVMFTSMGLAAFATQIIMEASMLLLWPTATLTIVMFNFSGVSGLNRVSIQYKFQMTTAGAGGAGTYVPNNTYSNLYSVTGAIYLLFSASVTITAVVFSAIVVDIVLFASALTITNAIQTCRQVKNCITTINAGSKYAADAYFSSDTSAAAANTAIGGWNN